MTVDRLPSSNHSIADVLRQHAVDTGAELMVMGAYGHSRLRKRIFGGARWLGAAPRIEDPQKPWLGLAARSGHTLLYGLLIALPLSGWYAASRLGVPVSFLGVGLPSLTASVQDAPGEIADLHETGGTLILWLAGLHVLIALWHQFILKDRTLERMNPMAPSDLAGDHR